jgi:hypothetical protein
MKVSELPAKAGLKTFNAVGDKEIRGVYISDMVSDIIGIGEANLVDVAAIVFSRGKVPADDVIALANKAGIGLLGYEGDTWTLAKKLYELGIR